MTPIYNYEVYQTAMKRSLYDKLFFVDKIDPSMIVDFGCADGTLMRELSTYFPSIPIIGVDNDPEMFNKCPDLDIRPNIPKEYPNAALILSSVLHEIHSYCGQGEIEAFWNEARRYDYIVIRDMSLQRDLEINHYSIKRAVEKIQTTYPNQLKDFQKVWGKIQDTESLIHFLLKYMYVDNWEREVQENYLINDVANIITLIKDTHEIIFKEHTSLSFLEQKWKDDLDISLTIPTHLKLIVKRK